LIGRDVLGLSTSTSEPYYSLVDESSKLDLNAPWLSADLLSTNFPNMTYDFANAIIDWRDTNGTDASLNYVQYGYSAKHSPFESVGELRLVYGATMELLVGDDLNRNGVLDVNEQDLFGNGYADEGLLGYFTVHSRQPNTYSDGTALTNVNTRADIQALLEYRFGTTRATEITSRLFGNQGGGGQGGGQNNAATTGFASLLQFYLRSGLTSDEFGQIYNDITATNTPYTVGRVNVNTASSAVLACLPGMNIDVARQLVAYRQSNPNVLTSFAWIVDVLGSNSPQLQALASGDYITAHSYQFSADIAAVGPFGRGYRRVRFVFDMSEGTPKVIYRQDLSGLGWALGKETRETWLARNTR
jgi:type II secretory pathway component PulK